MRPVRPGLRQMPDHKSGRNLTLDPDGNLHREQTLKICPCERRYWILAATLSGVDPLQAALEQNLCRISASALLVKHALKTTVTGTGRILADPRPACSERFGAAFNMPIQNGRSWVNRGERKARPLSARLRPDARCRPVAVSRDRRQLGKSI